MKIDDKLRTIPRNVGEYRFLKYLDVYGLIFMFFPTIFCVTFIIKVIAVTNVTEKKGFILVLLLVFLNIIIYSLSFLMVAILDDQLRGIDRLILIIKYKRCGNRVLRTEKEDIIHLKIKEGENC